MSRDQFDDQIKGQMTIYDLIEPPERLFAVSRIFARARKCMSLAEQKTFVYALSQMKFTEDAKTNYIRLNKKTLAAILKINSDPNHLSVDIFNNIKELPKNSYIEIADRDRNLFASGCIITSIISFKNFIRVRFNEDYIPLFTGLSSDYITMWSQDIFNMTSKRSVQFYEYLRQNTDSRQSVNSIGLGIKALKDLFQIPKDGKGSYMRKDGHFDRPAFEKKVIEPLCADIQKCKMINLVVQPNGKLYEKVKNGNRVNGYRFYWTYTSHPGVATAQEVQEIQERVDKNPQVLKVAKDIVKGEQKLKKEKKNSFNDFEQRDYSNDKDLENKLLGIM